MRIHFVLVREGSSDNSLIPHLERLCIDAGADEVSGTAPDFRRLPESVGATVESKIKATLILEPTANLIFIHRDSDSRNPEPRHAEISQAVIDADCLKPHVAVVPVQETEAWILLDEQAIRFVARKPRGRTPLNLPRPNGLESLARPKERLERTLAAASELTGRRLNRFKQDFSVHRSLLLQRLPIGGSLEQVNSWNRLRGDVQDVLRGMQ